MKFILALVASFAILSHAHDHDDDDHHDEDHHYEEGHVSHVYFDCTYSIHAQ